MSDNYETAFYILFGLILSFWMGGLIVHGIKDNNVEYNQQQLVIMSNKSEETTLRELKNTLQNTPYYMDNNMYYHDIDNYYRINVDETSASYLKNKLKEEEYIDKVFIVSTTSDKEDTHPIVLQ